MVHTEELSDFQRGTVIGCHLSNKSVCYCVKWKRLGATTAKLRSGKPNKLTEWDRRVLKRVSSKNRLSSAATLTTEFQTASGSNLSKITVCRDLNKMGVHGRAAAQKPKIIMHNAKCWLEWCKACRRWTLE